MMAVGRGRFYSPVRGVVESTLRALYRGGWPARVWGHTPFASSVASIALDLAILPPRSPDLQIGFASDLHLGPTTSARTLDRAFELLGEAPLDVLLLGGDYVFLDATESIARELEARIAAIPARVKLAVLGNHDLWADHGRIERALERAGVRVLINDAHFLCDEIAIVGLDDPWTGAPDPERAMRAAGDATTKIGLAHAPEGLRMLSAHGGLDFFVCGHTHGGHIALPSKRPVIVPGPDGRRFAHGLHRVGGTWAFTSRGVGGIELPIRANATPDVVRITLRERRTRCEDPALGAALPDSA